MTSQEVALFIVTNNSDQNYLLRYTFGYVVNEGGQS